VSHAYLIVSRSTPHPRVRPQTDIKGTNRKPASTMVGTLFCMGTCRWVMNVERTNLYLQVAQRPRGRIRECFTQLIEHKRETGRCPSYKNHTEASAYKIHITLELLVPHVKCDRDQNHMRFPAVGTGYFRRDLMPRSCQEGSPIIRRFP
jgi:hypothetical protein